jgi:hypothetical protein
MPGINHLPFALGLVVAVSILFNVSHSTITSVFGKLILVLFLFFSVCTIISAQGQGDYIPYFSVMRKDALTTKPLNNEYLCNDCILCCIVEYTLYAFYLRIQEKPFFLPVSLLTE